MDGLLKDLDDSNPGILAFDACDVDYAITRDRTIFIGEDSVDCFSYKSPSAVEENRARRGCRCTRPSVQPYRAWIIGQVHGVRAEFDYRLVTHMPGVSNTENFLQCYLFIP